ncbi:MAG: protein adenylyltransferase SelO, partial [Paludibacter sp.]
KLGDGRAILLGEQITSGGLRFDIQYKGSGITPYSRQGDGRATLRAMLREYIISEAMYALNIPTSRSLAVVATGEPTYREKIEAGAVLTRVAASHIRVGTFEHVSRFCSNNTLSDFLNYVIQRHYPELLESENRALSLIEKVIDKQTDLIVNWLRVGFIHGVMNTDNMTISGETIDYGPCAFMNAYNPETVFSSIDTHGRYAFGNQPTIALWNITRLAESLLPLIDSDMNIAIKKAEIVLASFQSIFETKYFNMLGAKIGINSLMENDKMLINELLNWMFQNKADFTNTYNRLLYPASVQSEIYEQNEFQEWQKEWKKRIAIENDWQLIMQKTNPVYIPRNHLVEAVIEELTTTGKSSSFEKYMERLSAPYAAANFDNMYMHPPSNNEDQCYKTYCGT